MTTHLFLRHVGASVANRAWRPAIGGPLLIAATLVSLFLFLVPKPAASTPEPGTGELCVIDADGATTRTFPLKHTKVEARVSGSVTEVQITQVFTNPYSETIEATYLFPLSTRAAVNDFEMRLGERVIRGVIQSRDEARRVYEKARSEGHVAALLEQKRPNVFRQSVANILPGNDIEVALTYVETLKYESGAFELVVPTVVGPRYVPANGASENQPAMFPRVRRLLGLPSGDDVQAPNLPPGVRSGNEIEIVVELDAGMAVSSFESPSHSIEVKRHGAKRATVRLKRLDRIPNKDFVLRASVGKSAPELGLLTHRAEEFGALQLSLLPPLDDSKVRVAAKEMVFVLDCSGSMSGEPLAAAKALARHAMTRLNPEDTFRIIRFSASASELSSSPLPATPSNVRAGLAYLEELHSGGGTEMLRGIRAALDPVSPDPRLRMVMFLTDGYIGNDKHVLREVRARLGNARLFSFGIGSSVNRFLLEQMAVEGRGVCRILLPGESANSVANEFVERIERPVLTDVSLEWKGIDVTQSRKEIPDLYLGQPLTVHALYERGGRGEVIVRGRFEGRDWSKRLPVHLPKRARDGTGRPEIATLWAREEIAELERAQWRGEIADAPQQIERLGLRHRLVTAYTSFVAVENKMVVSNGRPQLVEVPLELPSGAPHSGVTGKPRYASPPQHRLRALGYISSGESRPALLQAPTPKNRAETLRGSLEEDAAKPEASDGAATLRCLTPVPPPAPCRAEIRLLSQPVLAGSKIVVEVTLENVSDRDSVVPANAEAVWATLGWQTVNSSWVVTQWSAPILSKDDLKSIKPGEKRTYRVEITPVMAAFLKKPGTHHLSLKAGVISTQSNSIAVIVKP